MPGHATAPHMDSVRPSPCPSCLAGTHLYPCPAPACVAGAPNPPHLQSLHLLVFSPPETPPPVCPNSPHPPDDPDGSSCHFHPGWAPWHHHPAALLGWECQHPRRQRQLEPCLGGDRGRHGPTSSQGLLLGMSCPAPTLLPWKCRGDLGGTKGRR